MNIPTTPSSGTTTYGTASDMNTYPTVGGVGQSYNDNGCLSDDGTWSFDYDAENHLTSASTSGTSVSYLYDAFHRQIQKQVGSAKTRYFYAGLQQLEDYNGSNDTLQYRYIYGVSREDMLLRVDAGGTITYLHSDRLGSIVATSGNSGSVTAKYKYGPFGETPSLSGISYGYAGQRFDSETGLYFMRSRYYSPKIGRFLQPDMLGYAAGLNRYTYVDNQPLTFVDGMGFAKEIAGGLWTTELYSFRGEVYMIPAGSDKPVLSTLTGQFNLWLYLLKQQGIPLGTTELGAFGANLARKFMTGEDGGKDPPSYTEMGSPIYIKPEIFRGEIAGTGARFWSGPTAIPDLTIYPSSIFDGYREMPAEVKISTVRMPSWYMPIKEHPGDSEEYDSFTDSQRVVYPTIAMGKAVQGYATLPGNKKVGLMLNETDYHAPVPVMMFFIQAIPNYSAVEEPDSANG